MKEKRILLWIFMPILCIIMLLSFCFASINAKAEEKNDELVVGVPVDRCPIIYVEKGTGNITGIGVDLLKVAAENAGYKLKFTAIKEATIKDALDNEEYDIIMPFGSAIKSAQGKQTIISENLFETPFTLVTQNNLSFPQQNEIHIGMLKSQAGVGDTVKGLYPGMEISFFDSMDDSIKALRKGKVDALLHNSYVWSYILQKPSYQDLKVHTDKMFSMDFKVGALDTEKSALIIARLNEGIAKITDTKRRAITLDYSSRSLYEYDFSDYFYRYGLYVLLIFLLILALIVIAILRTHTMRLSHEKKVRELVNQDPLTGVLSLEGFRKKVGKLLEDNPNVSYLIIYTNIKNFKYVNDSLGKSSGDELLTFLAKSVERSLSDVEAIGRVNADRFVILYRNFGGDKTLYDYENKFEPIRNFFVDRGKDMRVLLCYGIYVLTKNDYKDINVDRMIDYAHLAEKKVREKQNEGYGFYNQDQWEKGKKIAEIINYLPRAIKDGGIQIWYQPQVDYKKGIITGAEALSRWNHEKLGFLLPDSFISILEDTGLIYELDCYVWERACQDLKRWNDLGYHQFVSVNVSRCDIREENNIVEIFEGLIKKYDLTPDQLRIEITESAYVEKPEVLIDTTIKLRNLGFQVEMDDFGSGYSSLNMLKEVPVDRVKLDLRFLASADDLEKCHIIINCMIKMLKQLKIKVIAEGVETKDQADYLLNEGCADMQGFYFYKAMKIEEFEKLFLKENKKE